MLGVAVVGGGVCGLVLARRLAKRGLDCGFCEARPRLRMRHIRFRISEAERDAWLSCMGRALKEVVADESLRAELYAAFAKLADWMRNDPGNPHDRRHERQGLR